MRNASGMGTGKGNTYSLLVRVETKVVTLKINEVTQNT